MFRQGWTRVVCFTGVAFAACGGTQGVGEPPGGEGLGPEPIGTVRLAITKTDCDNLVGQDGNGGWPFTYMNIVNSKYNHGDAGAVVGASEEKEKIPRTQVESHCASHGAGSDVVLHTLNLRPWKYRIGLEVIAEFDGTPVQINETNEVDVVVTGGSITSPPINVTQAEPRAVGVGATFTAWSSSP